MNKSQNNRPEVDKNYKGKETEKQNWFTSSLILIIIFLVIFIICFELNRNNDLNYNKNGDTTKPSVFIQNATNHLAPGLDKDAGDYVKPITPEVDGVAIPGWSELTIPVNTSKNIVVDFFNPDTNANKYYLTFELRIPANNEQGYEVLYKSGLVEPGKHIQKINLSRGLSSGAYDAILHIQPYRMSDKSTTNNADLKLELVVR